MIPYKNIFPSFFLGDSGWDSVVNFGFACLWGWGCSGMLGDSRGFSGILEDDEAIIPDPIPCCGALGMLGMLEILGDPQGFFEIMA